MTSNSQSPRAFDSTALLTSLSTGLADLIDRAGARTFQVKARRWRPATGVLYAPDLVLTADHVLEHEDEVQLRTSEGRAVKAEIAGRDPSTDLALLRAPGVGGTQFDLAENEVKPGHLAVSIARTWSNRIAASAGIVSAVGAPRGRGTGQVPDAVIRLDLNPHPGYSGGPIVDAQGRLIGLGSSILLRDAAAAVSAATAWQVAAMLAEHGHIRRGYLGISTQPVGIPLAQRGQQASERGLLIVGVASGSPADAARLLVGDILVRFDTRPVRDPDELLSLLTANQIGKTVPVTVLRGGDERSLDVAVGDRGASGA